MVDWMVWFSLAGVLVILEIFSGTFYLLMIALGLLAGGLIAMAGGAQTVQLIVAGLIGVIATYILRRVRQDKSTHVDSARDPNINIDIGQSVAIDQWNAAHGATPSARIMYRGAQWDAELAVGASAQPGTFIITEIRGSRLIVTNQ